MGSERATEYVGRPIVRNRTKHRPPTKRFQLERSNANLLPLLRATVVAAAVVAAAVNYRCSSLNFTFFFFLSLSSAVSSPGWSFLCYAIEFAFLRTNDNGGIVCPVIICRDSPSGIDFSRGTWLPASEPASKGLRRGVRGWNGKRSTTI